MSKDTIYREDAINVVDEIETMRLKGQIDLTYAPTIKRLKSIPSADRPQGKWKAKSFHEVFCNNCGFSFDIMKCEFVENMKYCPNCGVRKGADDDEARKFLDCACETCKHRDEEWDSEACDGCCENNDHYEPKDEPLDKDTNVRSKEPKTEPQTERNE